MLMYAFLVVFDFSIVFVRTLHILLQSHAECATVTSSHIRWPNVLGKAGRVCLLFFITIFTWQRCKRRFGMVEVLVQRYADSENWFMR